MDFSFVQQLNFKKIVLIVLFLILCAGMGFGGGVARIAAGGDTAVLPMTENRVVGATLSADGQGVTFYDTTDSKFYTLSADGEYRLPLSQQEFYQVEEVYWSDDKSKAIIGYPDGSKILYDFSQNEQITLSPDIYEPDFSADDRVAYKYVTSESDDNWLIVSDINTAEGNLIDPLGENYDYVQVAWSPNNTVAALYSKPAGLNKSEVFFIGLQGENFLSLEV